MTFKIMIATIHGKFFQSSHSVPASYHVINQYTKEPVDENSYPVSNMQQMGLSKSRNRALELDTADIILIADDDLGYKREIEKTITDAFVQHPQADIITFQIATPEGEPFKAYEPKIFWHSTRTVMRTCSVEIALRMESVKKYDLAFDEHFGLGAPFPTGEEIIFLTDALKKGLKILYIPRPIVIHPKESSGSNYANITLLEAKGAMFYRIFGFKGYVVSVLYALKKYKYSPMSMMTFLGHMYQGIKVYRNRHGK